MEIIAEFTRDEPRHEPFGIKLLSHAVKQGLREAGSPQSGKRPNLFGITPTSTKPALDAPVTLLTINTSDNGCHQDTQLAVQTSYFEALPLS